MREIKRQKQPQEIFYRKSVPKSCKVLKKTILPESLF